MRLEKNCSDTWKSKKVQKKEKLGAIETLEMLIVSLNSDSNPFYDSKQLIAVI